jgi:uncharacterized protein YcfJ
MQGANESRQSDLGESAAASPDGAGEALPAFETLRAAARRLGVDVPTLRRRCVERGERVGDCIVALLDGGVVAFKFGGQWRVRRHDVAKEGRYAASTRRPSP